jgi:hypothetical protein
MVFSCTKFRLVTALKAHLARPNYPIESRSRRSAVPRGVVIQGASVTLPHIGRVSEVGELAPCQLQSDSRSPQIFAFKRETTHRVQVPQEEQPDDVLVREDAVLPPH